MSSLRHTEDALIQAVKAERIGSLEVTEHIKDGRYSKTFAVRLEHLAIMNTVLVKLAAAKQPAPELRAEYESLVAQSKNQKLTKEYLLSINSFTPMFSSAVILKVLRDADQEDEQRNIKIARKIMASLGTLAPRYLIARLQFVDLWFQVCDRITSIVHDMRLRFSSQIYVDIYTEFINISKHGNSLLKEVEAEYSSHNTPSGTGKSNTELRQEVLAQLAREAVKTGSFRLITEKSLSERFDHGWKLADVWKPALEKYGQGLLKVFPFPEIRTILCNDDTDYYMISPRYYSAVFKALECAPHVDEFLLKLCKAVEDAQSFEEFDSWLQANHENYKGYYGSDMVSQPELSFDMGKEWIGEQLLASMDIEGMIQLGIDFLDADVEDEDVDMDTARS